MKRLSTALLSSALLITTFSCAHREDRQQGQILEEEDIAKIRKGMTKEAVTSILGKPILHHPFLHNRWIYTYYLWRSDSTEVHKNLIITFHSGGRVERISRR